MNLGAKFNVVLLSTIVVAFGATYTVVKAQLDQSAKEETLETAGLMMEAALSMRKYTSDQIRPLLADELDTKFHPQSVPAYSANQMFSSLRQSRPDIGYREATLNPSNKSDKATDWEADIIERFRNIPDQLELKGERSSPLGPMLFVARPIKIQSESCLQCHGRPEDLPATVRAKYGADSGLGWKLGEVVGAQIASVPNSVAAKRAEKKFSTFLTALTVAFLGLLLVINVLLSRIVIAPVKRIAKAADSLSTGDMEGSELPESGDDEVSTLAASFNRMRRSLRRAMEMIDRG